MDHMCDVRRTFEHSNLKEKIDNVLSLKNVDTNVVASHFDAKEICDVP